MGELDLALLGLRDREGDGLGDLCLMLRSRGTSGDGDRLRFFLGGLGDLFGGLVCRGVGAGLAGDEWRDEVASSAAGGCGGIIGKDGCLGGFMSMGLK